MKRLSDFRDRLNAVLLLNQPRPHKKDLHEFGKNLFKYIIRDDVETLYNRLPRNNLVRIHILTNRADLQSLPWEYLQDPKQSPGPWIERSIVRVVPTIGIPPLPPLPINATGQKIRILFVYADPVNQGAVSWPSVRASIEQVFMARIPANYELNVIEGTLPNLVDAFQNNNDRYEIFQFSGHGEIDPQSGKGQLLLLDKMSSQSVPISTDELSILLTGRGIRLAVLSACMTAAGNSADPFNVVAEALVLNGIPAVVANQLPVPDASVAAFVGPLYNHLLITGDIDQAVNQGRVKLAVQLAVPVSATLEWGIPTLYRHISSANIFQP